MHPIKAAAQGTRTRKKRITIVGDFIRKRRQELNLSQQRLGQMLSPPVTTQFMSNIERGMTPLPYHHIAGLAQALKIKEADISALLEREVKLKFIGKLGNVSHSASEAIPAINPHDIDLINQIYSAYQTADAVTQKTFAEVSAALLKITLNSGPIDSDG
jgi:transcriptional regulator with XRE-family HTH domain